MDTYTTWGDPALAAAVTRFLVASASPLVLVAQWIMAATALAPRRPRCWPAAPADGSSKVARSPTPAHLAGAAAVAGKFCGRARGARLALINGTAGAVWAPGGKPAGAFRFTLASGRIVAIELIADPGRLAQLDLTILAGGGGPRMGARAQ
jgi:hypothetical protein